MNARLTGQTAIVTGAGQGIGAAIAKALAAAGVKVVVNDLNPDRAQRVVDEINDGGGTAVAITADVSNKFQCSHLVDTTREMFGRLDILVNNAAIKPASSLFKTDEYEWQRVIDVNLKGPFFMTQLCSRVMAGRLGRGATPSADPTGGIILNICSTAGVTESFPNHAAYAASKAGVVGFAREAARELAPYGIRIHSLLLPEPVAATAVTATIIQICTSDQPPADVIQVAAP